VDWGIIAITVMGKFRNQFMLQGLQTLIEINNHLWIINLTAYQG
jgi:hypothetical protein